MAPTKSGKTDNLSKPKVAALLAVVVLVIAGAVLFLGNKTAETPVVQPQNTQSQPTPVTLSEEQLSELRVQYDELKQSIEQGEFGALDEAARRDMYIAAAFTGAQLRDPESSNYAKLALGLFPQSTLDDQNAAGLIGDLKAIESGDFDSYIRAIHSPDSQ